MSTNTFPVIRLHQGRLCLTTDSVEATRKPLTLGQASLINYCVGPQTFHHTNDRMRGDRLIDNRSHLSDTYIYTYTLGYTYIYIPSNKVLPPALHG